MLASLDAPCELYLGRTAIIARCTKPSDDARSFARPTLLEARASPIFIHIAHVRFDAPGEDVEQRVGLLSFHAATLALAVLVEPVGEGAGEHPRRGALFGREVGVEPVA